MSEKDLRKLQYANVHSIAVERRPDLFPQAEGKLWWHGYTDSKLMRKRRKVSASRADQVSEVSLVEYVSRHLPALKAEEQRRKALREEEMTKSIEENFNTRIDPEDGRPKTFEDLKREYMALDFIDAEVREYWYYVCLSTATWQAHSSPGGFDTAISSGAHKALVNKARLRRSQNSRKDAGSSASCQATEAST